jgi:hypothetical protein
MICMYLARLTGGPRLAAQDINLPEVSLELAQGLSCGIQYGADRPHVLWMGFTLSSFRILYFWMTGDECLHISIY